MSVSLPRGIFSTFRQIASNTKRLLRIAWEVDKTTTILFYSIAFLGALVPVITSFLFSSVIDDIQIAQDNPVAMLPTVIVMMLSLRSAIYILQDIVYHSFARTYLDHIFRYKLQNKVSHDFYKTVNQLDIGPVSYTHLDVYKRQM